MIDVEFVPIYCLNEMKDCVATYPKDVMGALFTCPFCGFIENRDEHIFEPSDKLIRLLDFAKEAMSRVH